MDSKTLIMHNHYVDDHIYYGPVDSMECISNIFCKICTNRINCPHTILNQEIRGNGIKSTKINLGIGIMRPNHNIFMF